MYCGGREHALRLTPYLPKPYALSPCSLSHKKAYAHGTIFGTTNTAGRSLRRILQPEKRLRDERYK